MLERKYPKLAIAYALGYRWHYCDTIEKNFYVLLKGNPFEKLEYPAIAYYIKDFKGQLPYSEFGWNLALLGDKKYDFLNPDVYISTVVAEKLQKWVVDDRKFVIRLYEKGATAYYVHEDESERKVIHRVNGNNINDAMCNMFVRLSRFEDYIFEIEKDILDIKPCPFCGSMFTYEGNTEAGGKMVCCMDCEASGPIYIDEEEDNSDPLAHVRLWNERGE